MLKKFAVTNFKGFRDRIELDLSKHRNYSFSEFAIKNGIIKDGIIYGPNGCGKSNLGFAIFDIVNHLSSKMKAPEHYVTAIYAGNYRSLMTFEYTFDFDGVVVEYVYSKNVSLALVRERLKVNGSLVFDRGEERFYLDQNEFPMVEEKIKALSDNSNNISIVNYLVISYPLVADHYLNKLMGFVDSMLWFRSLEERGFIGLKTQPQLLEEFIISNSYVDDFSLFLKEVSGQDYHFVPNKKEDKVLLCQIGKASVPFKEICSTGTSSLTLLYYWLKNLEHVQFLFIDEFDAFYHYKLSVAVCRRLFSLDTQVLLTSHNTYLMSNDILRPDCNFILDHNEIKALCDCTDKELRRGHNIEKMFRGGAFEE